MSNLSEDVDDGIENKPDALVKTEGGKIVEFVQLSDVMTPQYASCNTCVLNKTCSRVALNEQGIPDEVLCVIEKEMVQVLLINLHEQGVVKQDEFLVLPLIQSLMRMRKFYAIESIEDLTGILNNPEALDMYRKRFIMLNKTESQYLKIMKELMATRKEYETKKIKIIESAPDDFSLLLSEDDVENADGNQESQ